MVLAARIVGMATTPSGVSLATGSTLLIAGYAPAPRGALVPQGAGGPDGNLPDERIGTGAEVAPLILGEGR